MIILALEFSSAQRSVAVTRDGAVLATAAESGDPRVTNAFGLIEKALGEAKILREEVEAIAVGLGPGSYTGIRAAIAVAQGWQLARGVKLTGVSSVEAMAARAQAEGILGRVNVVVDAQRGEFYLATWDIFAGTADTAGSKPAGGRVEVSALKIVPAMEIAARVQAGEGCLGPGAERVLFPDAAMVAGLAEQAADFLSGNQLEPIYLRETSFVKVSGQNIKIQAGQSGHF